MLNAEEKKKEEEDKTKKKMECKNENQSSNNNKNRIGRYRMCATRNLKYKRGTKETQKKKKALD